MITNTTATDTIDLTATVNSDLYNIDINNPGTNAAETGNVNIEISNIGKLNVTLDAVYINGTLITFPEIGDVIASGSSLVISTSMTNLVSKIGTVKAGDKLEMLVRTKEGAEDSHLITVSY